MKKRTIMICFSVFCLITLWVSIIGMKDLFIKWITKFPFPMIESFVVSWFFIATFLILISVFVLFLYQYWNDF